MIGLSILIPVYRDNVVEQVSELCHQCRALEPMGLQWEVIVADDGSPLPYSSQNDAIKSISGCRLIKCPVNRGRAVIRNVLAREANKEWLLFQDAATIANESLVSTFLENIGKADAIVGSFDASEDAAKRGNLRCRYEIRGQRRFTVEKRNEEPYSHFHINNFMIRREVMLRCPFDETMRGYGYEDVIFGKTLKMNRVSVCHIDNKVTYPHFEDNSAYLLKIGESIDTLFIYRDKLRGYSRLLSLVEHLRDLHLLWLPHHLYHIFGHAIESNLKSSHPSLKLFSLYRLCLLVEKYC